MSTTTSAVLAAVLLAAAGGLHAGPALPAKWSPVGAPVDANELKRFTSPLPDGRGMPAGSGTAEQGSTLYASQCASCHGAKLEGGIGDRLIGGRGTLVNADPKKAPVKTVESYWPYATTLFDYIKRAMPLTAPGSLSDDQVYAVSAYILQEANILPPGTTLDGKKMAAIRMPNRDGFIPDPRPEKFPPPAQTPHSDEAIGDAARP